MFRRRLITVLWSVPLVVAAVWFDEPLPWFTVLAAAWGVLGAIEFYRMAGINRVRPLFIFGLIWTMLFIARPHCTYTYNIPIVLISAVVVAFIVTLFLKNKDGVLVKWAWAIAGTLYVGWLLSYLVSLRLEPGTADFPELGRNLVFLALFATFGSDSAAYLVGKTTGRHRMAPRISPGKTWEGAVGGLIGSMIITFLFTLKTPFQLPLSYGEALVLGLLVSVFGQAGDLVESMMKRKASVKESGNLMPGHGGILDRTDSILFAGVVVFFFNMIMLG